jgi:hypothetical protein
MARLGQPREIGGDSRFIRSIEPRWRTGIKRRCMASQLGKRFTDVSLRCGKLLAKANRSQSRRAQGDQPVAQ